MAQVAADVVDSSHRGSLPSVLPPAADLAAQSLWRRPELRGLSAEVLARVLHIRPSDARIGIAAVVQMASQTAHGGGGVLMPSSSLAGALGNLTMDQAMSRYAARVGAIVRSSEPGIYRSGFSRRTLAGALDATLESATQQMIDFLSANGCAVSPAGVVANFQAAYNTAGYSPGLTVDDKYGPLTANATSQVLSNSQNVAPGETLPNTLTGYTAPPACQFGGGPPAAPSGPAPGTYVAPTTVVTGTPAAPAPMQAGFLPKTAGGWAILALAVAVVALANSRHPPKWVPRELRFRKGHRR